MEIQLSRKLKLFIAGLFVTGWLFFIGPSYAWATDNGGQEQVIVSPAQSLASIQSTIDAATVTLSTAISVASPEQIAAATVPVATATTAIANAESSNVSAIASVAALDSQTAVVATATTNLTNAQTDLTTAQTTLSTAPLINTVTVTAQPGLVVKVYNVAGQNVAPVLPQNAEPAHTAVDTNGVNEYWYDGNVAGSNLSEDVIVTYEGQVTAPTGVNSIRFLAYSDDGAKIYIDNVLVVNNWVDQGPTWSAASNPIDFTNDRTKDINIWYYENGGGATLHLAWQHSGIHTGIGSQYLTHNETTTVSSQNPTLVAAVVAAEAVVADKTQVKTAEQATLATLQSTATATINTTIALANTATDNVTAAVTALQIPTPAPVQVFYTPPADSGSIDTTPVDTEPVDTTPVDTEPVDTEPVDTEPIDTEPVDTEPVDTEPIDTEPVDTEPVDTSAEEAEAVFEESEVYIQDISELSSNLTVVDVQEVITDLISDSSLDASEVSAVLEAIAEGGEVSAEVVAEVSESLSEGGLTEAESEFITEMLSADGEITTAEVVNLSEALTEDGTFTLAEKDLVADVLVSSAKGAPVTAANIESAGLEYRDLPPTIPVEVREDINGNPVVIQAEVASALLVLESPAALAGAIATCFNPDEAIEGLTEEQKCELGKALINIGADMSIPEREKAEDIVVVTVIAGQVIVGTASRRRKV